MLDQPSDEGSTAAPNLFSEAFVANPFPPLAYLRAIGPVVQIPLPFGDGSQTAWIVTGWQEAVEVLKDTQRFTVDTDAANERSRSFLSTPEGPPGAAELFRGRTMVSVDEPDHTRLRTLVSKVFTPRYVEGLRPRIQQIADDLLDRVQHRGAMDLVDDFAYPLPINVISEMLGVPPDQRTQVRQWSGALSGAGFLQNDPAQIAALAAFADYMVRLVAGKRLNPGDDLISQLIQAQEAGEQLDESELVPMVGLLIFAGHETTSNLLSSGVLMLLEHPEQFEKLKADLSHIPAAVEELLRFCAPAIMPGMRFATEAVTIGGQQIGQGDVIMVVLAGANRDPEQFTDPDELDIARGLNRHIAFGQGIHFCLGAPLARLEGEIALTTLLRRMPNIRLAVPRETLTWRATTSLRGLASLPVVF